MVKKRKLPDDWREWPDLTAYGLSFHVEKRRDRTYGVFEAIDGLETTIGDAFSPGDSRRRAEAFGKMAAIQPDSPLEPHRREAPIERVDPALIFQAFPLARKVAAPRDMAYRDRRPWVFDATPYGEMFSDGAPMIEQARRVLAYRLDDRNRNLGVTAVSDWIDETIGKFQSGEVMSETMPAWGVFFEYLKQHDIADEAAVTRLSRSIARYALDALGPGCNTLYRVASPSAEAYAALGGGEQDKENIPSLARSESLADLHLFEKGERSASIYARTPEQALRYVDPTLGMAGIRTVTGRHLLVIAEDRDGGLLGVRWTPDELAEWIRSVPTAASSLLRHLPVRWRQGVLRWADARLDYLETALQAAEPDGRYLLLDSARAEFHDLFAMSGSGKPSAAAKVRGLDEGVKKRILTIEAPYVQEELASLSGRIDALARTLADTDADRIVGITREIREVEIEAVERLSRYDTYRWLNRASVAEDARPSDELQSIPVAKDFAQRCQDAYRLMDERLAALARETAEHLRAERQDGARQARPPGGDAAGKGGRKRHEDVGEHIGGARKDAYRRIGRHNLDDLSLPEKVKLVRRDRIWPKPDVKALRDEGFEPAAVHVMLAIRSLIDPDPRVPGQMARGRQKADSTGCEDTLKAYVEGIEDLKKLFADRKTLDDLKDEAWRERLFEFLEEPGPVEDGSRLASLLQVFGKRFLRKMGSSEYFLNRQIDRMIAEARRKTDDNTSWEGLMPAKTAGRRSSSNPDGLRSPYPPHLERMTREGPDWRKGEDADGEKLLDRFEFRGIEYGNWVSHKERQQVLNFAEESLNDLALVTGVPVEYIGLRGRLGLAFGARGRGGRAKAHYEPERVVINLTKLRGAGSVAHEWFHAVDHDLGKALGLTDVRHPLFSDFITKEIGYRHPRTREDLLSLRRELHQRIDEASGARNDPPARLLAHRLVDVLLTARYARLTPEMVEAEKRAVQKRAEDHLVGWLLGAASDTAARMKDKDGRPPFWAWDHRKEAHEILRDLLETYDRGSPRELLKTAVWMLFERAGVPVDRESIRLRKMPVQQFGISVPRWVAAQDGRNLPEVARTAFYEAGYNLDKVNDRSPSKEKYWSTPHEMLARAFSCEIHDRLEERDYRNTYLVSDGQRGIYDDESVYRASANPEGMVRDALREPWARFMDQLALYAVTRPSADDTEADETEVETPGFRSEALEH